jgi:hypothetical protein
MDIKDIAEKLLKPSSPTKGPPLPESWNISWPGFFSRGINRITTEGVKGPYKTVREKGLKEELKREIQIVTGWRPKQEVTMPCIMCGYLWGSVIAKVEGAKKPWQGKHPVFKRR